VLLGGGFFGWGVGPRFFPNAGGRLGPKRTARPPGFQTATAPGFFFRGFCPPGPPHPLGKRGFSVLFFFFFFPPFLFFPLYLFVGGWREGPGGPPKPIIPILGGFLMFVPGVRFFFFGRKKQALPPPDIWNLKKKGVLPPPFPPSPIPNPPPLLSPRFFPPSPSKI